MKAGYICYPSRNLLRPSDVYEVRQNEAPEVIAMKFSLFALAIFALCLIGCAASVNQPVALSANSCDFQMLCIIEVVSFKPPSFCLAELTMIP